MVIFLNVFFFFKKVAAKVKEILSANTVYDARVEGLVPNYDFKLTVTREDAERVWAPLLARVAKPIEDALVSFSPFVFATISKISKCIVPSVPSVHKKGTCWHLCV